MLNDQELLASVPEFISFGAMLKATPSEDGGRRFIYFEASNEAVDRQGEVVLQKALKDSAEFFLRHGNIDIDHYTMVGPKLGIPGHLDYEIGKPVDVRVDGKKTFVKAELYSGSSAQARNADAVWNSMTQQQPAARWYPSVGGGVLAKSVKIDPDTHNKIAVIERVRWSNVALSRTPQNGSVPTAQSAPMAVFAKSMNALVMKAALEAGYGTNEADLEGGAALRKQSLDKRIKKYMQMRDEFAKAVLSGGVKASQAEMVRDAATRFGLPADVAGQFVNQFLDDISTKRINHVF
jgi:hypothetical protein